MNKLLIFNKFNNNKLIYNNNNNNQMNYIKIELNLINKI